jgi:HK97 family phage portal protein
MTKRRQTTKAKDSGIELDSRQTLGSWVSASLIPGEAPTSKFNNNTGRDYELVTRGITGTAWRAASINATVLSGQTLRLFRRAGSGSGKGRKIADRRLLKHVTNNGRVKSLVGKAALYASRAGDEVEEVLDHPVLDLLQNPDPVYTGPLWLWQVFWFKEVAGRAYLYVGERLNGYPVSAYILPSEFAWPMLSDTGLIEGYFYGRNRSHPMRVPAEDVVYLRQHGSPIHPAGGMSWLQSITPETDMEAAALQSECQRWLNGGQPGMVFQAAPATTDAQMKQIQAHLNQSIRSVTNAGKVLLLRDTELKQYGAKPHEMQYVEGLTATEKRIYDAAGIPEPIYRLNSANLASASVANAQYMRYTIAPRLAVMAAELTELMLPHFGVDPGEMWFCFDDPNQDDQIQLASELRAAEAQGLVTPNEYRAIMDLEALPDELNTTRYRQTDAGVMMPSLSEPAVPEQEQEESPEAEQPAQPEPVATNAPASSLEQAAATGDAAATALNGAQVQALSDLAMQVATGQLPADTAQAIASAAFPLVPATTMDSIFGPLAGFKPTGADATAGKSAGSGVTHNGSQSRFSFAAASTAHQCIGHECGSGPSERWAGADALARLVGKQVGASTAEQASGADAAIRSVAAVEIVAASKPKLKAAAALRMKMTVWDDATGVQSAVAEVYRKFEKALTDWYAKVIPDIVGKEPDKDGKPHLHAITAVQELELKAITEQFIHDALAIGGADGLDKIGVNPEAFSMANEDAIKFIQQRGLELAKSVPETLKETVNAAIEQVMRPRIATAEEIAAGIEVGQALPQLSVANVREAILGVVPDLTDYQAERIARTELTNAFNEGNRQGWKQAGVATKQWSVAGGQCELCDAIAIKYPNEIPIDELFTCEDFIGQGPTAHPNCRCGLIPGVEWTE